jgi:ADP-glucose pyrophosphorylase
MDDLDLSTARYAKALRTSGTDTFCESSLAIVGISSPVHLYQANMHQNVEIFRELVHSKRGNSFGPGATIHPSAVVEGSTLGPGVYIGAQSIVRNSVLGKDAVIADAVVVHRSVIGDGVQIYPQCRVVHSVMYPESFLSHSPFQFSLMGREAAVFATIVCDARMDQKTIRTIVGGRAVDSGLTFLGLTVGHRAKVAGGVVTEPGRIVPNDVVVFPPEGTTYKGWSE